MRGHGPLSKASRAAATARDMSPSFASGTRKKISSVPESMTSIVASDDGLTHSPPMKNRSAFPSGTTALLVSVIVDTSGRNPAACRDPVAIRRPAATTRIPGRGGGRRLVG